MANSKIRVLLINDSYYPKYDGPVLVIASYAKHFNSMPDIEAEIIVPNVPNYKDTEVTKVIRTKSKPSKEGYYQGKPKKDKILHKYLKNNTFDIIHCHSPFTMCRFFAKYGKKHGIPTVFTFHTKFHEDFQRILRTRLTQRIMMRYIMSNINKCDRAISVSNGAADVLREYGYKKDIKVIRNGTDLTYPDNAPQLIADVNNKYKLEPDKTVFLSVGRIVANKKLPMALEALSIVAQKGYGFKFLIVGSGPDEESLKELVSKHKLDDKVIFTGKVSYEHLPAYYVRSNALLLPSTFDTSSLVFIEAAALKLPTIMNKGCIPAEVVTSDVNGLLVEQETKEAWADKIIWAITHKEEMKRIKENCYTQIAKNWYTISSEVKDFYFQVIKDYKEQKK